MRRRAPLSFVCLEDRLTPSPINFTLTTATSKLSLSGNVDGNAITQQGTGSLTTTYSGTVAVDVNFAGSTIEFLDPGSSMNANNSGTWAPAVGGGTAFSPGSGPANYGGNVTVSGLPTKVAGRGMIGAFTSTPLAMTGSPLSFASTQTLTLTAGTIDYNNLLLQGTSPLNGSKGDNAAANGTFTDAGNGNYTLVMPGLATILDTVSGLPLVLNITGTLNATATLPVVDLNGATPGFDVTFTHKAGGAPSKIAPAATITRTPAANLTSMTITLNAQPDIPAESLAVDLSGTTLTTTGYDNGTGTLTITGSGSLATYQSVLQKVTYADANAAGTPGPRPINVSVTDAGNASLLRSSLGDVSVVGPAKISSVQVNDNSPQRSRVTSLQVTFDSIVTLPTTPATAFQLVRSSDNKAVNLSASVNNSGPGTVVTLTFTGGAVNGASLADGRYTLTAFASQINGGSFDGDGNSVPGDDFILVGDPATNKLFRLFGDSDGNGTVNATDFADFGVVFGGPGFAFDFDGNNTIDGNDLSEFGNRFGITI